MLYRDGAPWNDIRLADIQLGIDVYLESRGTSRNQSGQLHNAGVRPNGNPMGGSNQADHPIGRFFFRPPKLRSRSTGKGRRVDIKLCAFQPDAFRLSRRRCGDDTIGIGYTVELCIRRILERVRVCNDGRGQVLLKGLRRRGEVRSRQVDLAPVQFHCLVDVPGACRRIAASRQDGIRIILSFEKGERKSGIRSACRCVSQSTGKHESARNNGDNQPEQDPFCLPRP